MAEAGLADYIRVENAKEREEAGLEGAGAPLPVAETITASESASPTEVDETPAVEIEVSPTERNLDGTFKVKKDTVQQRIDKAVKAQREAERKADASEARARALEARQPTVETNPAAKVETAHPASDDAPTLEGYISANPNDADPLSGFTKAVAKWAAKQALTERDQKAGEAEAKTQFQTRMKEIDSDGRQQFSDWHEVMSSDFASTFPFPPHIVQAVHESNQSAALLHYLGTHPDEARALAAKTPTSALVTLGTLAARLMPAEDGSGVRSVVHSKAKPLTKPLRGSTPSAPSSTTLDPATTPLSDWIRINNAEERRRAL